MTSSTAEGQSQSSELPIQALRQRVHQLVDTVHTVQQRCDELTRQDAAARTQRHALSEQLTALTQEREQISAQRQELAAKLEALSGQCNDLQRQRDTLTAERDTLQAERDALSAQRDELQQDRDRLSAKRDGLRAERDSLLEERNALQESRDALQTERDGLQLERDDLSSRLVTLTSKFQELARQRQELSEQHEKLSTQNDELQQAQNRIIIDNENLADAKNKLKIKYSSLLSERDSLKIEIEKASVQLREKPLVRLILKHGFQDLRGVLRCLSPASNARPEEQASHPKSRKLSKTIGTIEKLDENASHKFAASHTICHYESNTVATYIPKNACTSLRYSFAVANGAISDEQDFDWVHANSASFCASKSEICQADYTFAILRNPFTRTVSFFLDKLAGHPTFKGDTSYANARKLFPLADNELTFRTFVSHLWDHPEKIARNQHMRPQVDFLLYDSYDDLFSFEQFDKAAARINAKCGLRLYDTRELSRHTTHLKTRIQANDLPDLNITQIKELASNGSTPCPLSIYDDEIAFQVHAMYFSDVLLYQDSFGSTSEIYKWLLLSRRHACNTGKLRAA